MIRSIIFNCSNAVKGGTLKNALLFIEYSSQDTEINWLYIVNPVIYARSSIIRKLKPSQYCVISFLPSNNFFLYLITLFYQAHRLPAKTMYSLAGPVFIPYLYTHIMGISDPFVIFAEWKTITLGRSYIQSLLCLFKTQFKRFFSTWADFYLFQTTSSLQSFSKRFSRDSNLFLLPNAYIPSPRPYAKYPASAFSSGSLKYFPSSLLNLNRTLIDSSSASLFQQSFLQNSLPYLSNVNVVLIPGAYYPHKGYFLLPDIIDSFSRLACKKNETYVFILTLPTDSPICLSLYAFSEKLTDSVFMANIGPFNYDNFSLLASNASLIFIPSLLEVFSASYVDAIANQKPLVVSNNKFALDICSRSALYVDPFNPDSTALTILSLLHSSALQDCLLVDSSSRLNNFISQQERYQLFKSFLSNI